MSEGDRDARFATALVTGASSGIGRAIAVELAARGTTTLVLVARRIDRLDELADELDRAHGTVCEVLPADLTDAIQRSVVEARLRRPGDRPPVDLLVNNAGIGLPGPFIAARPEDDERVIALNVVALTALSHAALDVMVARGRGALLNVSSMAAYQPSPSVAVYAATKAFVTHLSEALHEELRGTGVTVTALLPGYTRTEFADHSRSGAESSVPDFAWMSAESVARAGLDATAKGRALCVPGLGYKAVTGLVTPLPRTTRRWLMGRVSRWTAPVRPKR